MSKKWCRHIVFSYGVWHYKFILYAKKEYDYDHLLCGRIIHGNTKSCKICGKLKPREEN